MKTLQERTVRDPEKEKKIGSGKDIPNKTDKRELQSERDRLIFKAARESVLAKYRSSHLRG